MKRRWRSAAPCFVGEAFCDNITYDERERGVQEFMWVRARKGRRMI